MTSLKQQIFDKAAELGFVAWGIRAGRCGAGGE